MDVELVVLAENASEYDHLQILADEQKLTTSIADEINPQFVDPVTAVLIGGAVLAVAKVIHDWIGEYRGGTQIDRSVSPAVISRSKQIPWGTVVVIASDGKVSIQVEDAPKDALERWIEKLMELPGDAAKATIDALSSLLKKKNHETAAAEE